MENKEIDIIEAVFGKTLPLIYRPELRMITGKITSTILLSQVWYWWKKNKRQEFYKFKQPCNHKLFKEGDSWCEELGFSPDEFDGAIKHIGFKLGKTKNKILKEEALITYYTDAERITWYILNEELLAKRIKLPYLVNGNFKVSRQMGNSELHNTENTTKITTKNYSYRVAKPSLCCPLKEKEKKNLTNL